MEIILEKKELDLDDINYNCMDCSSLIEILLINEENNIIRYKCINNHYKDILIKEYLKYIKKNKNLKINDICELHKEKYSFFCFDCKSYL